jgi:ATP-binding cassette, subfamily C (CFTR/MRP), member 1
MERCPGDNGFGPVLEQGPCHSFDFTLAFEESIFAIAPCTIAIPLIAARLWQLWNRPVTAYRPHQKWEPSSAANWPLVLGLKLVSILLFSPRSRSLINTQAAYAIQAILQLALLSLWASGRGTRTNTTLAAAVLSFVSTLCLLALSVFEHGRDLRPSILVQLFLSTTILLDLPRVRTQWLLKGNSTVASLLTVALVIRVVIVTLESLQKWETGGDLPAGASPEMMQGLFGHTFMWWLNPLFQIGYKRDICMDDLHQLDHGLQGEPLGDRLLRSWDKGLRSWDKG